MATRGLALTLEERLAITRDRQGLSQEQMAELLGVSRQLVSGWESGTADTIRLNHLRRWAEITGVLLTDLLPDFEEGRPASPRTPTSEAAMVELPLPTADAEENTRHSRGVMSRYSDEHDTDSNARALSSTSNSASSESSLRKVTEMVKKGPSDSCSNGSCCDHDSSRSKAA